MNRRVLDLIDRHGIEHLILLEKEAFVKMLKFINLLFLGNPCDFRLILVLANFFILGFD